MTPAPQRPQANPPRDGVPPGEKTIMGEHYKPGAAPEEQSIPMPEASEAVVKLFSRGTLAPYKLKKDRITTFVGGVREDCDIFVKDQVIGNRQVAIIQYNDDYILTDCGVQDLTLFDGIPARQIICPPGTRAIIQMGTSVLIFSSQAQQPGGAPPAKRFHLEEHPPDENALPPAKVTAVAGKRECHSSREPIVIGRHDDCDLKVTGEGVKPFHALICWRDTGVFAVPLGRARISQGGTPVESATQLPAGESELHLGQEALGIAVEGDAPARGQAMLGGRTNFEFIRFSAIAHSVGGSFMIPAIGGGITIGRSPACHITLDDGAASREHCQLIPNGKSCQLIDNYSANGCYVNDEKVNKVRLRGGDNVEIGRSVFVVHYD